MKGYRVILFALIATASLGPVFVALAQDESPAGGAGPAGSQPITIKREPLQLVDPKSYSVPLRTLPIKSLELTADRAGQITTLQFRPGQKVSAQAEALRLDSTREQLAVDAAKARLEAAKIELKINGGAGADQKALAQARIAAAEAEFKIAELELERTIIKAPFAGEVFQVHVIAGQFVQAGQPLLTLADTSSLLVEVPADRTTVKAGDTLDILVEKDPVKGKVQVILPPSTAFEPLRTLVNSLSTAVVQVDNPSGKYFANQSVFSRLIPLEPYAPVPTVSLENQPDGTRKVQVLRQGVVRDVTVTPLTQVGSEQIFVAGKFATGDELIVSKSTPLKDGDQVRPQTAAPAATASGVGGSRPAPRPIPNTGF